MKMVKEEKVNYILKKVVTRKRTCPVCDGAKINGDGSRCIECSGTGKTQHKQTTESDLIEALHTTGFIKWIKDNFQRIENNGDK